jgi:predicted RNA binding protein YcfA (HicA-like mRNA interferase family)
MSQQLPSLTAEKLIRFFQKQGFYQDRQSGSHLTLKHSDGRVITIPVHTGKDIGKGLLKRILKDAGITVEEFNVWR